MATIPQRELRNNITEVLRRAEAGERLTVTVNGRPVAELGPLPGHQRGTPAELLRRILAEGPVDQSWADDLRRMRDEDLAASKDPWRS
jgi:prevent-host-death family protein